jgi:hypothetical protein
MFGAARGLRATAFGARFLGVRFVGIRFPRVLALRGERDLRAMILLTPARLQHAMAGPGESRRGRFLLAAGLRRTSGN